MKQRAGVLELCVQRPCLGAALDQLGRLGPSASTAVAQLVEQPSCGAGGVAGLAQQPPAQAPCLAGGGGQQVDADHGALAVVAAQQLDRRGERAERVGVELEALERLDARAREDELGA